MNDQELLGKRVLVIGGETELGRAVLIGLAEAGADIAIASLTADTKAEFAINSALNELWALGRKGVALAIDASDAEMLRRAIEQAEGELGALDLVVVVYGTGIREETNAALAKSRLLEKHYPDRLLEVGGGSAPADAIRDIAERLEGSSRDRPVA